MDNVIMIKDSYFEVSPFVPLIIFKETKILRDALLMFY